MGCSCQESESQPVTPYQSIVVNKMDGNHPQRILSLIDIYARPHWFWCVHSRSWRQLRWGNKRGRGGVRIRRVPWPGAEYLQNPHVGVDVLPQNNINILPAEMHNAADVLPNLMHQLQQQQQLEENHNPADEDLLILNKLDVHHFLCDEVNQLQPQGVHPNPVDQNLQVLNQLDAGHVLLNEINQVHDTLDALPPENSQLAPQVEHPQLEYHLDAGDVGASTQVASSSESEDLQPPPPGKNMNHQLQGHRPNEGPPTQPQ